MSHTTDDAHNTPPPSPIAQLLTACLHQWRRLRLPPRIQSLDDPDIAALGHDIAHLLRWSFSRSLRQSAPFRALESSWELSASLPSPSPQPDGPPLVRQRLLIDNAEAFDVRDSLYAQAQRSIKIVTYALHCDDTGWRSARALTAASARGVSVHLIIDRFTAAKERAKKADFPSLLHFLRQGGVEVLLFNDPGIPHAFNHRKICSVDGQRAIIGGRNLGDAYAQAKWRDVELLVEGGPVQALEAVFDQMRAFLLRTHTEPPPAPSLHTHEWSLFTHSPAHAHEWPEMLWLLRHIQSAGRTIDLEHAYFINFGPIDRALRAALRRGVRVRLFTNSPESNDLAFGGLAAMWSLPTLLASGAEIYLRTGAGRTLHSKYVVIDAQHVLIGSTNLSPSSVRMMFEISVGFRNHELGSALNEFFEDGIRDAMQVDDRATLDRLAPRRWSSRVMARLTYDFV